MTTFVLLVTVLTKYLIQNVAKFLEVDAMFMASGAEVSTRAQLTVDQRISHN